MIVNCFPTPGREAIRTSAVADFPKRLFCIEYSRRPEYTAECPTAEVLTTAPRISSPDSPAAFKMGMKRHAANNRIIARGKRPHAVCRFVAAGHAAVISET